MGFDPEILGFCGPSINKLQAIKDSNETFLFYCRQFNQSLLLNILPLLTPSVLYYGKGLVLPCTYSGCIYKATFSKTCFFNPGLDSPRGSPAHQSRVCKGDICTISSSMYAHSSTPEKNPAFSLGIVLLFTQVLKQGYCFMNLTLQ